MASLMMARDVSKQRLYHDVLEACQQPGCPICRLGQRTVSRYLDIVAYENVNDHDVRDRLRAAWGFCNHHAWQYHDEVRDLLGIAIIYRDVLNTAMRTLLPSGRSARFQQLAIKLGVAHKKDGNRESPIAALTQSSLCPACACLKDRVPSRIQVLLEHLTESSFVRTYSASTGLCHPHFLQALSLVRTFSQLVALVRSQDTVLARGVTIVPKAVQKSSTAEARRGRPLQTDPAPDPAYLQVESCFGARGVVFQSRPEVRVSSVLSPSMPSAGGRRGDASSSDSCPVCEAIHPMLAAVLRRFLRELLADPEALCPRFAQVCNRHAWQLSEMLSFSNFQAIFPVIASRRRSALDSVSGSAIAGHRSRTGFTLPGFDTPARRLGRELAFHLDCSSKCACPLCEEELEIVMNELWGLFGQPRAPDDRRMLSSLCLPHLRRTEYLPLTGESRTQLADIQVRGWNGLISELWEYIRKQDYRFMDEPRGSEQSAPRRALEQVAGRKS